MAITALLALIKHTNDLINQTGRSQERPMVSLGPVGRMARSSILCEHANEVPRGACPCPEGCPCRQAMCQAPSDAYGHVLEGEVAVAPEEKEPADAYGQLLGDD